MARRVAVGQGYYTVYFSDGLKPTRIGVLCEDMDELDAFLDTHYRTRKFAGACPPGDEMDFDFAIPFKTLWSRQ